MRASIISWAFLGALTSASATASPAPMSWDFVVTLPDLERGLVDVDWTLRGFAGRVRACSNMDGCEKGVRDPRQVMPAGEKPLVADGDCWVAHATDGQPLTIRYRYDLAAMARKIGNPDKVSRSGDTFLFNDEAVLLHPDPLPEEAPITVELRLPEGISVATPWARLPGPGWRFRTDSDQYDAGNYIAVGHLLPLGEVAVRGGVGVLTVTAGKHRASDATLKRWVARALGAVAEFYRGLPGERVEVLLVPTDSSRPGVFGTVLRYQLLSVVLYFGADAGDAAFDDDWIAPHELFHLGNPLVERRLPWLIEGFTTYYQDVLRGRAHLRPAAAMWGDLYDGFRRNCSPQYGASLSDESRMLNRSYHYSRVYWGGACLAFRLDVAIRKASHGKASLDDVMRDLRRRSMDAQLSESEITLALDRAAGAPIAGEHLKSRRAISLDDLYKRLGIEPTGDDAVRLHEDAPDAALRRQIMDDETPKP